MSYGNTEGDMAINWGVTEKVAPGLKNEGKDWERKQPHTHGQEGAWLFLKS